MKWLNLPQVAEYVGYSRDSVERAIARGEFPVPFNLTGTPRGNRWKPEWLDEWINQRRSADQN